MKEYFNNLYFVIYNVSKGKGHIFFLQIDKDTTFKNNIYFIIFVMQLPRRM